MFAVSASRTMANAKFKFREPEPLPRSIEEIRAEKLADQRRRQREEMERKERERQEAALAAYRVIDVVHEPRTVRGLIERIARDNGVTYQDIVGVRRHKSLMRIRHLAIRAAAEEFPDKSLVQLGKAFNRDHTTILHALHKSKVLEA
jgi:chromosomal replication initiation ATPase DnaA